MKFLLFSLLVSNIFTLQAKDTPLSAAEICLKTATAWAVKSEAKHSKSKFDQIKIGEKKSNGSGASLYLMSVFVEGPKTGDNTHWEIVGEYRLKTDSCKILLGRRYWAH
jgi:hypothetical protein